MEPAAERRAIVLGVTADHGFAAGALLAGLAAHEPGLQATAIVYHDGLPEADRAALAALWPGMRFRDWGREQALARLGLDAAAGRLEEVLARFSPLVLAKLELPDLLDEFDRCLWLDADLLVRRPAPGLWDFDALAWRPLAEGAFRRRDKVLAACAHLTRDPATPLPNGGVVGVARALRETHGCTSADLFDLARFLIERTDTRTPDELAFYLLAASRSLPVTALPMALNHPVTAPGTAGAAILHAIGPHKFWNATPLIQLYPDWAAHHAAWVAAGGTPHGAPILLAEVHSLEPAEVLRAAQLRSTWLAVYDRLRPDLPAGVQVDPRLDGRQMRITFAGLPEAQHLRLGLLANPRRLVLELHLHGRDRRAATEALRQSVPGLREGEGDPPPLSVPLDAMAGALATVAAVLEGRE